MGILNPRFESPGANPGEAEHWTLLTYVSGERIAGFGPEPYRAWEDFERWFEFRSAFEEGELILGFFDPLPEGLEDFNEAWDNDSYLFELPAGHVISCAFSGSAVEDMEDGWLSEPFVESWDDIVAETGMFDGEPAEDFEENWMSNQSFIWNWADVSSETALFDGGAQPVEDFENSWGSPRAI